MKLPNVRSSLAFLTVAALATPASGAQMSFIAVLNGAQEVPPVTSSNGQGVAHITLDSAKREVCFAISYTGLSGPAGAMHFHGPAMARANAGVQVDLSADLSSPAAGCAGGLTSRQMSDLKAGLWYLNVHTADNPAGEIRGQVERVGTTRASRRAGGRVPVAR